MSSLAELGKVMYADMTWRWAGFRDRVASRRQYLTPQEHVLYWRQQGYDAFQVAAKLATLQIEGRGAIRASKRRRLAT